jgi:hypothetical protein
VLLIAGDPSKAASITWHFMASEASSTLGPTTELLDYFDELEVLYGVRINIQIWVP